MSFHNPGAWALAALAIPIVVFYLWRFAGRRQPVATFPLWQAALARRPAWFVLRFWLSLAAQIVVLLLLVAALARPYWTVVFDARRSIVLVLDVSASMSATDVAPSRFAAMQDEAARLVGDMNRLDRMAVVAAGSLVRIVHRFTDEPQSLAAAVRSLEPTDGTTRVVPAVRLARRMLDGEPNPQIIVLTDGAFDGAGRLAAAADVQMKLFGSDAANVAITRLAARPDPLRPEQYHVLVEAANYAAQTTECTLRVSLEGNPPLESPWTLAPDQRVQKVVTYAVPTSGVLSASLTCADALATDNLARILVESRRRPAVVLIADAATMQRPEVSAIKAALDADPRVEVRLGAPPPDNSDPDAVTVFCGHVPPELPDGPLLAIAPHGDCQLWDQTGQVRDAQSAVGQVVGDEPLLAGFDFATVVVEQAVQLRLRPEAERWRRVVATAASGDPLISVVERPEGRIVVLHASVNPNGSDLLRRPDFPALLRSVVHWLLPPAEPAPPPVATDQLVALRASDAPRDLVRQADKPRMAVAAEQTVAVLDRAGLWTDAAARTDTPDRPPDRWASNLTSPSESDLRVRDHAQSDVLESAEPTGDRPLWMLLVGVAVLLVSIEWCLFHRRVVV